MKIRFQVPRFIKPLSDGQMVYVTEGDSVFLEAQVVPTDDNTLTVRYLAISLSYNLCFRLNNFRFFKRVFPIALDFLVSMYLEL